MEKPSASKASSSGFSDRHVRFVGDTCIKFMTDLVTKSTVDPDCAFNRLSRVMKNVYDRPRSQRLLRHAGLSTDHTSREQKARDYIIDCLQRHIPNVRLRDTKDKRLLWKGFCRILKPPDDRDEDIGVEQQRKRNRTKMQPALNLICTGDIDSRISTFSVTGSRRTQQLMDGEYFKLDRPPRSDFMINASLQAKVLTLIRTKYTKLTGDRSAIRQQKLQSFSRRLRDLNKQPVCLDVVFEIDETKHTHTDKGTGRAQQRTRCMPIRYWRMPREHAYRDLLHELEEEICYPKQLTLLRIDEKKTEDDICAVFPRSRVKSLHWGSSSKLGWCHLVFPTSEEASRALGTDKKSLGSQCILHRCVCMCVYVCVETCA